MRKRVFIINSTKAINSHRRHENSVTLGAFDVSQLKEIISVQKLVQEGYEFGDVVINKSETYAQRLYEQFKLSSEMLPKVTDHPELVDFYK